MKKKPSLLKPSNSNHFYPKSSQVSPFSVIKLPHLPKASSPQLSHKFFINSEDASRNSCPERKPTQSLYSFSFAKLADEISLRKKIKDESSKEDTNSGNKIENTDDTQKLTKVDIHLSSPNFDSYKDSSKDVTESNLTKAENLSKSPDGDSVETLVPNKEHEGRVNIHIKTRPNYISHVFNEQSTPKQTFIDHHRSTEDEKQINEIKEQIEQKDKKYEKLKKKFYAVNVEKEEYSNKTSKILENNLIEIEKKNKANALLKEQLEEMKHRMQNELKKCGADMNLIKEELAMKSNELQETNALLLQIDMKRKRFADSLKQSEDELLALKFENSKLKMRIESLNNEVGQATKLLQAEQEKSFNLENSNKDIISYKQQIAILTEDLSERQRETVSLKAEINNIQAIYSKSKSKWREKKKMLKENILLLNNRIDHDKINISLKIADAFKNKRSVSIREPGEDQSINSKETIVRLQVKIFDLEASLAENKVEQEKLLKSVEYYKNLIENKNHIISVLENKLNSGKYSANSMVFSEKEEMLTRIEQKSKDIKDEIKCESCYNTGDYLMVPCSHIICSKCMNFGEYCPSCSNSSRIYEVSRFKNISNKLLEQLEIIKDLQSNIELN